MGTDPKHVDDPITFDIANDGTDLRGPDVETNYNMVSPAAHSAPSSRISCVGMMMILLRYERSTARTARCCWVIYRKASGRRPSCRAQCPLRPDGRQRDIAQIAIRRYRRAAR